MSAEILAIGSELVSGEKPDSNGRWLAGRLGELGIPTRFLTVLGDDLADNVAAFRLAIGRARVVLASGGLGPTQDDLTREALAAVAGVPLVENADALAAIGAMFARRNRPMADRNKVQALFPRGAEPLPNRVGSAPGIGMEVDDAFVACMPGVPYELKIMFDEQVVPRLAARGVGGRRFVHRTINLFGRGESDVEAEALDLTARGREPEVGITVHDATITFRITASGADEAEALAAIAPTLAAIRERFGSLVVGEGANDVTEAVAALLIHHRLTLATAESCTGGLIAHRLTMLPGISATFLGGAVTYAPEAKSELAGVPSDLIEAKGVVSPEVAEAMALGIRYRLGAAIGLAVTGLAGPDGGTPELPVGTVYLGLATAEGLASRRLDLGREQPRDVIISRAAKHALNWVRLHVLDRYGPAGTT